MSQGQVLRLVELRPEAMAALVDGDLEAARAVTAVPLPEYFTSADCVWLWRLRLEQVIADPGRTRWVARAAVDTRTGVVVGHAGFHDAPDASGLVEIGYAVAPEHRGRGYGRAMVRALLRWAAEEPGVTRVRASIRPDNVASLGTIAGFDFALMGKQMDEVDGLELVFERPA